MKKLYTILCFLAYCLGTSAQVEPNIKPEVPESGKQYVLVNKAQTPSQYMSRTGWDGALYYLGKEDSHYADYALTAIKNDDGSWSFTLPGTKEVETGTFDIDNNPITETVSTTYYMVLPEGRPNVNVDSENPASWRLDPKANGFYHFILGDNQNSDALAQARFTPTGDIRMHMNGNKDYIVIQYPGAPYYPDCYGGIAEEYDEGTGDLYFSANDSITFYWGLVKPENLDAYLLDFAGAKALDSYEAEYLGDGYESYSDGFTASYQAALSIYKSPEYNPETDNDLITDLLNKKVAFYNAIEEALLIDDADATLLSAISSAESSFKTATSVNEIDNAIESLQKAVAAFKEGVGDYTAMGKNMSFEDLSSQGGSETSSVADVPTGWNMYINGTQVYTSNEIRNNGIANWCGINSDSDGEGKDGYESFGIWTSGVPTFELSQTISGLENGTYIVGAGLMAGANNSGSRLTTQRIFGNLNSTYYGEELSYDTTQLDASEVYTFQNNPEVVTDRTLYPMVVRAYVYDGTLTFGIRTDGNIAATYRTNSNGSGGDGWFKVDNFTILKEGYNGDDAAAVANHYIGLIQNYISSEVFEQAIENELKSAIGNKTITATTPASEINAVITSLSGRIPEIKSSITAYQRLIDAVNMGYDEYDNYAYTASIDNLLLALEEAEEAYNNRSANNTEIDELIARIENAISTAKSEAVQVGGYANVIANPSFEDLSAQNNRNSDGTANPPAGWTLTLNGLECKTNSDYGTAGASMGWCAINGGDPINSEDEEGQYWTHQYTDGEHVWGIWANDVPEVELSQTIKGLPAGTYTLSCDMVVQYNWGGQCLTTQRIFANRYVMMFGAEDTYAGFTHKTEDMLLAEKCDTEYPDALLKHMGYYGHYQPSSAGGYSDCPRPISLTFGLVEGEDLKLGFRTNNVDVEQDTPHPYNSAGWFKLDNFKLLYDSDTVPEGADATLIQSVESNGQYIVGRKYYTLGGVETNGLHQGVTIVKHLMSDGSVKTTKVYQTK